MVSLEQLSTHLYTLLHQSYSFYSPILCFPYKSQILHASQRFLGGPLKVSYCESLSIALLASPQRSIGLGSSMSMLKWPY